MSTSYLHTGIRRRRSASYARENAHTPSLATRRREEKQQEKSRWAESENVVSRDGTEHRAGERTGTKRKYHTQGSPRDVLVRRTRPRERGKERKRDREGGRERDRERDWITTGQGRADVDTYFRFRQDYSGIAANSSLSLSVERTGRIIDRDRPRWTIRVCVRRVMLRLVTLVSRWISSLLSRHEVSQWRRVLFGRDFVPTTEQTLSLSLSASFSLALVFLLSVSLFLCVSLPCLSTAHSISLCFSPHSRCRVY